MATLYEIQTTIHQRLSDLGYQVAPHRQPQAWPDFACIEFFFKPEGKTKIAHLTNVAEDIGIALNISGVRIAPANDSVVFRVPIPNKKRKLIKASDLPLANGECIALLGKDIYGNVIQVDLNNSLTPHILIGGTTGSGKTACAHTALLTLARQNPPRVLSIAVIDPKRENPAWLTEPLARHLTCDPISDVAQTAPMLAKLARNVREWQGKPLGSRFVLYVDEFSTFLQTAPAQAVASMYEILRMGRSAGIHVIACTQVANVKELGEAPALFPVRVAGLVMGDAQSKTILGFPGAGAHRLLGGGDMLIMQNGTITNFQAAIPDGWKQYNTSVAPEEIKQIAAPPAAQTALTVMQADDDEPEIDVKEVEIRFMAWLLMQQEVTSDADLARKIWGWDRLAGWKHRHFNHVKREAITRIENGDATLLPNAE